MPRAPAHARLCVVGVSLRPLSGLSPELRGRLAKQCHEARQGQGAASCHPTPISPTGHNDTPLGDVRVRPSGWGADMARTCQLGWLGVWLKTIGPEELALR
jgi:hypothetical protein